MVDDYAHHPTEVAATLAAARQRYPATAIVTPSSSRTSSRARATSRREFGRALLAADHAVVTDVYPSRERPIEGVTGELVVAAARAHGHGRIDSCPDWRQVPALLAEVGEGDVILTLGAGDIYRLARQLAGAPILNLRKLPPLEAKVLPFRRPSAAVRFRRKSPWLTLGKPFLAAVTMVGTPFAVGLWLFTSPTFGLSAIEVEGNASSRPPGSSGRWRRSLARTCCGCRCRRSRARSPPIPGWRA